MNFLSSLTAAITGRAASWPALILFVSLGCQTPQPTPARSSPQPPQRLQTPSSAPAPAPSAAATAPAAFRPEKLAEMDAAILQSISSNRLPGAVLWVERKGSNYHRAYGSRSVDPQTEAMSEDTIFDAASLTKVIATTPSVLLLIERGKIDLDAPVKNYIPEFGAEGKEAVTIRHLLTHTSGLAPGLGRATPWQGYDTAIQKACAEKLLNAPGTVFRYSDINYITLGEVVRRVSGMPLNTFAEKEVFQPLGMRETAFLPPAAWSARIAPTERAEGKMLRGVVHDPTARRMDGVAGHAGLFTTASNLARFSRMMLNEGSLDGKQVFKPATVRLMTTVQSPKESEARRGLGWDIDSAYNRPRGDVFPLGSYGHTGWTGTSIWIDPFSKTFWIFLSNRVHPDGQGNILPLQRRLGTLAAESVIGFNFASVPGALKPLPPSASTNAPRAEVKTSGPTLNGIDVLAAEDFRPLRGLRVGLVTNHTGVDKNRRPTIDLLHGATNVQLKALFSPEHGIRGALDEKVADSVDPKTGLPIFSLYGETRSPKPEQLKNLDALVFDIQDIGCRFYTYISTMGLSMEAAGKAGIKFFVLDRPNPINGLAIDGPVLNTNTSFTAFHPIPVRHGMTVGELAKMFNAERKFNANLQVIPMQGWTRSMWLDATSLPWINPSPNMRSLTEAALYPGVGLLEMNPLSVGRGTATPFEVIGAPYIDEKAFALAMNAAKIPGVEFKPLRYTPTASVFKGEECGGVSITLTDRAACPVVDIGITAAKYLHKTYPDKFKLDSFNRLLAHRATLDAVRTGRPTEDIRQIWAADLEEFKKRREKYLIYP